MTIAQYQAAAFFTERTMAITYELMYVRMYLGFYSSWKILK